MIDGIAEAPIDPSRAKELIRVLGQVVKGDFSEKPRLEDQPGHLGMISLLSRLIVDDLEAATRKPEYGAEREHEMRFRRRFINQAAHQLRTPLTPIRVQMKLLKNAVETGGIPPEHGRAVDLIDRNVTRLLVLMEDLLAASKMDEVIAPKMERLDIAELVSAALDGFGDVAAAHSIKISSDLDTDATMDGDSELIRQAVSYLIANAFKHTPEGGEIYVQVHDLSSAVMVQVHDNGTGFDAEQAEAMFDPFQAAFPGAHGEPASQLGLYVARGIVERHGGILRCDSPGIGHGATFCIALPKPPAPRSNFTDTPSDSAPDEPAVEPPASTKDARPPKATTESEKPISSL